MFRKVTYNLIEKWEADGKVRKLLCALKNLKYGSLHYKMIRAIGNIGNPAAVKRLLKLLENSGEPSLREEIVVALGRIGDPRAVTPIAQWISKGRFEMDLHVTEALGRIGTPDAIGLLIRWLDFPNLNYLASAALTKAAETINDPAILMAIAKGRLNAAEQRISILKRIDDPQFYLDYVSDLRLDDYLELKELLELVAKKVNAPEHCRQIVEKLRTNNSTLRPYHYDTQWETCPTCEGKGWWRGMEDTDCMACEGTGRHKVEVKVYEDKPEIAEPLSEKEAKGADKVEEPSCSEGGIGVREMSQPGKTEGGKRILSAIIKLKVDKAAAKSLLSDSWPSATMRFNDLIEKYGSCDNASIYLHYSGDSEVIVHADSGKDEYHHHIIRTDSDAFVIGYELTYWG